MELTLNTIVALLVVSGCGRVGFSLDPLVDAETDVAVAVDAPALPLCDRFVGPLVCETFEGGHTANVTGGGVAEPGGGYDGDGWRFDTPPAGNASLHYDHPLPTFGGAIYLGGRMKIDAGLPVSTYIVLAQLLSPTFEKTSFDDGGGDRPQIVSTVGGTSITRFAPVGSFPRGRWFCFELRVFLSDTIGTATLLIDGTSVAEGIPYDTLPADGVNRMEVGGLAAASNADATVVHVDNWVVTGGQDIGCP